MMVRAVLCVALGAALIPAQNKNQDELRQLRTEKQKREVFTKADWTFDFDAARAEAKETGKLIFAYFTRSYAH